MLCEISCQDVFLTFGNAFDIGQIVIIGRQWNTVLEIVQTMGGVKSVCPSVSRLAVLTHHPHHKLLLTPHGVVCDVLQPYPDSLAVGPPGFVHYFDYSLIHCIQP